MIICMVEGGLGLPALDPLVNWGMNSLYGRLGVFAGPNLHRFQYENYHQLFPYLHNAQEKTVCIGYSGGASRLTYFNHDFPGIVIDLMVLYDPSPSWQLVPLNRSVKKVISYENQSTATAMMPSPYGMLGAGHVMRIEGMDGVTPVIRRIIEEQHLAVQHDEALHTATIAAIKELHDAPGTP